MEITQLSKIQKLRILANTINSTKELSEGCKRFLYLNSEDRYFEKGKIDKISKKTGVSVCSYPEAGSVDLTEYISLTQDILEHDAVYRKNGVKGYRGPDRFRIFEEEFYEDLKIRIEKFESGNIPSSGPAKTLIGEIFRAINYIQYRAFNDGDDFCVIGSPSFTSCIFVLSQVDLLNYSHASYNESRGEYYFEFTEPVLEKMNYDGKISTCIEDSLGRDADLIKAQLLDLLDNGVLEDRENIWDSRTYKKIVKEKYW